MNNKTGYRLSIVWRDWSREHRGKYFGSHYGVYKYLCDANNRAQWRDEFSVDTDDCMDEIGMKSPTTFRKTLHDLHGWGLVKIISKPQNQHEKYVVSMVGQIDVGSPMVDAANDVGSPMVDAANCDIGSPMVDAPPSMVDAPPSMVDAPTSGNDESTCVSEGLKQFQTSLKHICASNDENSSPKNPKSKKFIPPTLDEFTAYFIDHGFPADLAKRVFNGYSVADWVDSHGKPIKNWRQKCLFVWFKEGNKSINNNQNNGKQTAIGAPVFDRPDGKY